MPDFQKVISGNVIHSIELEEFNALDLMHALREEAMTRPVATGNSYLKAVNSFGAFLKNRVTESISITRDLLADWFVAMIISGLTRKTAISYINNVSSLFGATFGDDNYAQLFAEIKASLRNLDDSRPDCMVTPSSFERLINLMRICDRLSGGDAIFCAIAFVALSHPELSIDQIARIRKDEVSTLSQECITVIDKFISSTRKYAFPLGQSEKTPKQLKETVENGIMALFRKRNIDIFGMAQSTIRSYWAYAAIKVGITPTAAFSLLNHAPTGLYAMAICNKCDISAHERNDIAAQAQSIFISNPMHWHAMKLRPGVKFPTITERLAHAGLNFAEFFYPCTEIAKRIGKKLVYKNQPLIADIAFFRSRLTDIQPMFQAIGDLAWCYREKGNPSNPYAMIPDSAMQIFQTTVGVFTPGTELYPLGTIDLQPNDVVEIVGDLFSGYHGIIQSPISESPTVYRLIIMGGNGLEWRADIDQRLLKKTTSGVSVA